MCLRALPPQRFVPELGAFEHGVGADDIRANAGAPGLDRDHTRELHLAGLRDAVRTKTFAGTKRVLGRDEDHAPTETLSLEYGEDPPHEKEVRGRVHCKAPFPILKREIDEMSRHGHTRIRDEPVDP